MKRPSLVFFTQEYVNLPAYLAKSTKRYAIILSIVAVIAIAVNASSITQEKALWAIAGVSLVFAIICGIGVTILDAMAWNFERLREELGVQRQTVDTR